jgi:sulfite reductase beta subunit-like hemoprotein
MEDQLSPMERQYAEGLSSAIEVVSAIVEAFEDNGDRPDATLADYITTQKIGHENFPAPVRDLLSGLANLSHLLLGEGARRAEMPEQDVLDLYADKVKKLADGHATLPGAQGKGE